MVVAAPVQAQMVVAAPVQAQLVLQRPYRHTWCRSAERDRLASEAPERIGWLPQRPDRIGS